jgi:hypothetical protein
LFLPDPYEFVDRTVSVLQKRIERLMDARLLFGKATKFRHRTTDFKTLATASPNLTKRYEPVLTGLAGVNASLRLASYKDAPPPS